MTVYLDTSDLVKLYVDEPGADDVRRLVGEAEVVVTSAVAYAETRATFARRRRERLMTAAESKAAIQQFDADWPRFMVLPVDADLAREAGRLADAHAVRGCDALHLAAFEFLLGKSEDDVRFSCADARLKDAARALG